MGAPNKLVLFVLVFCLLLLNLHRCRTSKRCLLADAASHDIIQSRKLLYVLGGKTLVSNMNALKTEDGVVSKDKWEELRRVPSGPDPLHHNGSGSKKPRNSP